jgi:O-succinylbenzoate synthase
VNYRFAFKRYARDLRPPLRTAHGPWAVREGVLVRLESESGAVGYGEIAPIPWFGTESVTEAGDICARFGAQVDDAALDAVPVEFACVRFALAAARMPAGDAAATPSARLPVCSLLPAGRGALDVLPGGLEAGFLAFKWKVGVGRPEDELGILDDLCGMLPSYAGLRLDANGAWNRRDAEKWLERCAERPVEFVEQPSAVDDPDLLLGLARDYPVTLALDESVTRLAAARDWQARGWPGVFVIKPALAGTLEELAGWATATKPDIVISSAIETFVGRAAILRFVLTHDLTKRALGVGVGGLFGDRACDGPVTGPLLDMGWCDGMNQEETWNALN